MGDAIPSWDNLHVRADSLEALEELTRLAAAGAAVKALFVGADSEGRQLAAELVAAELDMELQRVDLGEVANKYIGETEKNLAKSFDSAERQPVVLFFDEADALFGKRTEVKDAHDRYANQATNYLLQRLESHEGLVILSTNDRQYIDPAFLRRLSVRIEFKTPGRS